MAAISTSRSCTRCNTAKRKCDRVTPSCRLCRRKKLECVYPSERLSSFVPIQTTSGASTPPELSLLNFESTSNELNISEFPPLSEAALDIANPPGSAPRINYCGAWFLAPETFMVDHTPMPLPPNFKISDLKGFVRLVEGWMAAWITTGSNPFIHAHLYRSNFPSCLQIAFTTLSAYLNRTQATTDMILRAVNDQASTLVSASDVEAGTSPDLLEDLAHIHALLVYQMVGLFDGDIRSRHLAEQRAAIFTISLDRAIEKASRELRWDLLELDPNHLTLSLTSQTSLAEPLWRSWIISESLRRTWLICNGISASYDGLKQGWTPCNGDVMFTSREGLWSAGSALSWGKMCMERDVRFVGRFRAEWLFEVAPEEVDEFGKVMLESIYGRERSMTWLHGTKC
ncbi:hypothetical protein K505DRAFT_319975 [Melanomma pulvis-pyrius CBS 109.77]|uniref:Zn(2)-C6 fungal-type domain-containing protein n=1 Tax=Melanomma pulvis-pyrius CBS 109.77 TaxID=1314802 RepID=A0A6A6Y044_9PLEO|nr:hypothetical protein K505DRAFT_319975 [Melanomma pulvis-pyrius CBS 109.77]